MISIIGAFSNLDRCSDDSMEFEGVMVVQSSVSSDSPSDDKDGTSRLHIRGIKEMPAGHDSELAIIFSEMRRATSTSRKDMAGRLETSDEILDALESGAILALPPWPELSRIVTAYANLLGLDSRPLLRRLEVQLSPDESLVIAEPAQKAEPAQTSAPEAPKSASTAPPPVRPTGLPMPPSAAPPAAKEAAQQQKATPPPVAAKSPVQPPRAAQPSVEKAPPQYRMEEAVPLAPEVEAPQKKASGILKRVINWFVLIGFIAALGAGVWYAAQRPQMVWSAVDALPNPAPSVIRSAWKFMRPLEGKSAGSQLSNPDSRKSDKLPQN